MRIRLNVIAALLAPAVVLAAPKWTSDFERGDFSDWSKIQAVSPDRTQIVEDPVREGRRALRVVVRKGDDPINSGNDRAELLYMTYEEPGSTWYYRWSVMFDESYPSSPKWQLFTQWHQEGLAGTPPIEIYVVGEEIRLRSGGNEGPLLWTAPLVRGKWQDFILKVTWSSDPSKGAIELFHNGKVALPEKKVATLLPGQRNYLKMGLYRSKEIGQEGVVYFDDVRMSSTLGDVLAPPPGDSAQTSSSGDGGFTSGTVVSDSNGESSAASATASTDPAGGGGGCSSGGTGTTLPLAAVAGLLLLASAFRRRRTASVAVRAHRSASRPTHHG